MSKLSHFYPFKNVRQKLTLIFLTVFADVSRAQNDRVVVTTTNCFTRTFIAFVQFMNLSLTFFEMPSMLFIISL